jgi:hypothetical protein
MRFAEAFKSLGYDIVLPRLHWSASNENGVCISLCRSEIDWPSLVFDTQIHAGPPETWNSAGDNKRRLDLQRAIDEFDGRVDVVVVDGIPGNGVAGAHPWKIEERQNRHWRITDFQPATGHFRAEAAEYRP